MDLPVWQVVRDELRPLGLEIVAVAMDSNGIADRAEDRGAELLPEAGDVIDQIGPSTSARTSATGRSIQSSRRCVA
jgi:hypothetical protein